MRVRGFRPSISASRMRLNVIATERAETIETTISASRIQNRSIVNADSRQASRAPVNANGSAKTECSNLIISSVNRVLRRKECRNKGDLVTILFHAHRALVHSGCVSPGD